MEYKLDMSVIESEHKLAQKVTLELQAIDGIAWFGRKGDPLREKRASITAFQGVGRAFAEFEIEKIDSIAESVRVILEKYYTTQEYNVQRDNKHITIYFYYDCSGDGEDEVYCE